MKMLRSAWVSGALAVIAVVVVVYQFAPLHLARASAERVPPPAVAPAPAPQPVLAPPATPVIEGPKLPPLSVERGLAESRLARWMEAPEHDPFLLLSSGAQGAVHRYPSPVLVWKLKAIWRQTDGRVAAIDNHIYAEGDKVQGYRILKIDADRVVVEGPDGAEVLTFAPMAAAKPGSKK